MNETLHLPPSRGMLWGGRVMSAIPAMLLLVDGVMKIVQPEPVVKATVEAGYPAAAILPIGVALVVSAVLYMAPPTAVLGAVMLTGYLGGAVATHVRLGENPATIVPALVFATLLWGGLVLREPRLRAIFPWRAGPASAT